MSIHFIYNFAIIAQLNSCSTTSQLFKASNRNCLRFRNTVAGEADIYFFPIVDPVILIAGVSTFIDNPPSCSHWHLQKNYKAFCMIAFCYLLRRRVVIQVKCFSKAAPICYYFISAVVNNGADVRFTWPQNCRKDVTRCISDLYSLAVNGLFLISFSVTSCFCKDLWSMFVEYQIF